MNSWKSKKKRGLMGIRNKGMHPYLIQMARLKFDSGQELPTILVMSDHPSIMWVPKRAETHRLLGLWQIKEMEVGGAKGKVSFEGETKEPVGWIWQAIWDQ